MMADTETHRGTGGIVCNPEKDPDPNPASRCPIRKKRASGCTPRKSILYLPLRIAGALSEDEQTAAVSNAEEIMADFRQFKMALGFESEQIDFDEMLGVIGPAIVDSAPRNVSKEH